MVAYRGTSARFVATPSWVVALSELLSGAGLVSIVTCGENGAWNRIEQFSRSFGAKNVRAIRDITGSDENWLSAYPARGRRWFFLAPFASTYGN
jgi:hypothetical protein